MPLLFIGSPSAKDPTWNERSPGNETGRRRPRLPRRSFTLASSPGKSTLSLVSLASYHWFEEWKDDKATNRAAEYKELKKAFIDSILEVVMDVFPKVTRDKVASLSPCGLDDGRGFDAVLPVPSLQIEYVDAGTPITNTHYIGAPKGEIYGAEHDTSRFTPELNANVRPQTPLKNLYLTGGSSSPRRVSVRPRLRWEDNVVRLCGPAGQDVFVCGFAGALAGALSCGSVILNRNLHLDAISLAKRTKLVNNKMKGD